MKGIYGILDTKFEKWTALELELETIFKIHMFFLIFLIK